MASVRTRYKRLLAFCTPYVTNHKKVNIQEGVQLLARDMHC